MKLADAARLQLGWPLRHRWTGDRAVLLGVDSAGRLLVHFDHQQDGCNTGIHAEVMEDGTKPVPPDYATEDCAGYTRCTRCGGVYDIGPGDRSDDCPDCGLVYWDPEPAPPLLAAPAPSTGTPDR